MHAFNSVNKAQAEKKKSDYSSWANLWGADDKSFLDHLLQVSYVTDWPQCPFSLYVEATVSVSVQFVLLTHHTCGITKWNVPQRAVLLKILQN